MRLTFLGGAGTVTGSKYLLRTRSGRMLVDCGLFQGLKQLRNRNWEPLPVLPHTIDAVALTHAHIDHSGYLPLLVKNGFEGPIYCTEATRDLCEILLPDSGYLQEEEAEEVNRRGYSRHTPALPLYTREDAVRSLEYFEVIDYRQEFDAPCGMSLDYRPAGHILGAASILVREGENSILFSGDLGRYNDPVLPAPEPPPAADVVVVESTYGDRRHAPHDPSDLLESVINRTTARDGVVIIPSFAVGRAQLLLYMISRLRDEGKIPEIPIYVNSPMAVSATEILFRHRSEHRLSKEECRDMNSGVHFVRRAEEAEDLLRRRGPMVVISASGMATGGRVLNLIRQFGPEPENTILFAGYQAVGTRGADMVAGERSIKIYGEYVQIESEVVQIDNLSAHADVDELMRWLSGMPTPPEEAFITHGEPRAADALRRRITERLGWECRVPEHGDTVVVREG